MKKLFRTKQLSNLDSDKQLRELIQQQMSFAYSYLCIKVKNDLKLELTKLQIDYRYINVPLICEMLYNEVVKWVIFNHITSKDDLYVKDKQEKLWLSWTNGVSTAYLESPICNELSNLNWYSEYWHNYINTIVSELLVELERIRFINDYQ